MAVGRLRLPGVGRPKRYGGNEIGKNKTRKIRRTKSRKSNRNN
jgi:hypothetical protein